METKNCKSCKKDFEIRAEDKVFFEQVKSPLPLYCPDCRMQRRLAFRNERTLYKRPCDLCKTDSVSLYPSGTAFPVYCHKCWWSDKWDPREFAQDYDPNRPFLEQFKELQAKVPRISLLVIDSVRCDYTNNAGENKDCYLIFAAENNEDCMYSRLIMKSKQCVDCASVYESELCYECIDSRQCFKCMYSEQCQSSTDLLFCYNMRDCQNCILSSGLRHASYMISNEKVSREEFEKRKAEILSSHVNIEVAKKEYEKIRGESLVKYSFQTKCHNTTGDYMFNCYDGVRLFDVSNAKNSSYMADATDVIDSMDCNNYYLQCELQYDMMGVLGGSKNKHGFYVMYSNECEYCDSCYHSNNLFGCVRLNKEGYSILNKKYEKAEYEKLREQIIESMKAEGTYGQFLPPELSPFGYNETLAKEYFPMTKEESFEKGFRWQDETTGTFGKETIMKGGMPETIEEVTETILKEILVCETCNKNFRLTQAEFDFYKRMHLSIPHQDFECRHQTRMSRRNPRKLWHRACMCERDSHGHDGICTNEFETSYSPTRTEVVYCEGCYQKEVE